MATLMLNKLVAFPDQESCDVVFSLYKYEGIAESIIIKVFQASTDPNDFLVIKVRIQSNNAAISW